MIGGVNMFKDIIERLKDDAAAGIAVITLIFAIILIVAIILQ